MPTPTSAVGMERRLAAILHADVQGYSRLIEADEVATLRVLTPYLQRMTELVRQHGGRPIGSRGDSLLAEFPSVRNAVQCAVEIQRELGERNAALPAEQRIEFRMGIHVGEVVEDGAQLHGDGINIAVRIEGLAEAGGICLSDVVYHQVKNKLPFKYEDLGEQHLKNIAEPVRVYRVVLEEADSPQSPAFSPQSKKGRPTPRRVGTAHFVWAGMAGLALLVGVLVTVHYLVRPPLSPQSSALITEGAQPPSLPLPDKPSIVVLPFTNMSGDPEQEYFSDGITEELTASLSRLSGLFVISRNSAFTYKGKAVKARDVSKEFGVKYVLEGSVRKAGNQVRVIAQLIDATQDHHLWSERYDRPLKDIFALQDEIVQRIVTTLKLQLALQEQGYTVRKRTEDLEAYDYYLRGQGYHWRYTKEALAQARQMYERALALDPQYAEVYAWLGMTYYQEWVWQWNMNPQTLERALALGQKAATLDDSLPLAHSLLSAVYAQQRQYDQAIAEGERAIALDPNNADSYAGQAEILSFAGRPEEALRAVEQAMRLNPRYPAWYLLELGWPYRMTGQLTEAVAAMQEFIRRSPNHPSAHFILADSYVQQWASQQSAEAQTLAQAVTVAQRGLALNDASPLGHSFLGHVYLWQKQYEQALAELERAIALDPSIAGNYAAMAEMLSRVGKAEEALQMVAQALRRKPLVAGLHLHSVGAAYYLAGWPEEAAAPLQQYLARYPKVLGAHLTLAAVYSELGKEAEAQAEAAEVLRLNPQFSLEVHKGRAPIKDPAMLERHIAALRKAGLK